MHALFCLMHLLARGGLCADVAALHALIVECANAWNHGSAGSGISLDDMQWSGSLLKSWFLKTSRQGYCMPGKLPGRRYS